MERGGKVNLTTVIGIPLGIICLIVGMIYKGASPSALLNPAAILIIFGGTASAILLSFPKSDIKTIPKLIKILFTESKFDKKELISTMETLTSKMRKEGTNGLEAAVTSIDNTFIRRGVDLILEGKNADDLRGLMEDELELKEHRHSVGRSIFTSSGTFAPTLGVLGAVVGLIAALGNLNDIDALGPAISAAFVATLFGIYLGYVISHPIANKLKRISELEIDCDRLIIEGVVGIVKGKSPRELKEILVSHLPEFERVSGKKEKSGKE